MLKKPWVCVGGHVDVDDIVDDFSGWHVDDYFGGDAIRECFIGKHGGKEQCEVGIDAGDW